jgi:nucleotide-binding universal stress UspA family protein
LILLAKSQADIAYGFVGIRRVSPGALINPGTEIAEYADEIGADLIVIPSHGYHGVKRLLLGSVAERVIRAAHCSVLVLRRSDAD